MGRKYEAKHLEYQNFVVVVNQLLLNDLNLVVKSNLKKANPLNSTLELSFQSLGTICCVQVHLNSYLVQ